MQLELEARRDKLRGFLEGSVSPSPDREEQSERRQEYTAVGEDITVALVHGWNLQGDETVAVSRAGALSGVCFRVRPKGSITAEMPVVVARMTHVRFSTARIAIIAACCRGPA